jgi:DNA-directed RNA polymerase subunit RPC12/RpoP
VPNVLGFVLDTSSHPRSSSQTQNCNQYSHPQQETFHENSDLTDAIVRALAERVLLSVDDVNIWFSNVKKVQRNRKEGPVKAAKTRRKSRQAVQEQYKCGVCQAIFEEETAESETWIGCEECDSWFHWTCVGITVEPDIYTCTTCS